MNKLSLTLVIAGIALGVTLLGGLLFRGLFLDYVDNYEFGYMFDARTGDLYPLLEPDGAPKQGYIFSWPIVQSVHTIDTRPMQVCINANSRVLNCKLVQFDPKGLMTFVSWHGRGDYSIDYSLKDIMLSYAYDPSNQSYPFLKILKELKNQDIEPISVKSLAADTQSVQTSYDTICVSYPNLSVLSFCPRIFICQTSPITFPSGW